MQIRAKVPGVCLYHAAFAYPTDPQPGVLSVEPIAGASIADLRESSTGAISLYFRLDHDAHPDDPDPYKLSFRVRASTQMRAAPRLRYFADAGNEQLSIRVSFSPSMVPATVWWFAAPDVVDAEQRAPAHQLERPDAGNFGQTFDRLVPGWCYGIAWTW